MPSTPSTAKPLVALHGSYYGYNFGDTLLCALFCQWLQQAGAEVVLPQANALNQHYIGAEYRGIRKTEQAMCMVFCGGGYFGEAKGSDWKWPIRNYFRHFRLGEKALKNGVPLHIMGIGAGPISSGWLKPRVLKMAKKAHTLIVRDEPSQQFFVQGGLKRNIPVATDAALSITPASIAEEHHQHATDLLPADKKYVLIHFTRKGKHFDATLATLISFLKKQTDLQPVVITDSLTRQFVLLPNRQTAQDIAAEATEAALLAAGLSPIRINHDGNPMRFCAILNRASLIMTNKLHVGIVGTALRKFVISLPHHQKTPRFYNQLKLADRCLMEEDFTTERFSQLLQQGATNPKTDWTEVENRITAMPYQGIIQEMMGND